jgi:DtxR family Mn-dependent transcriptional regulator
MKHESFNESVEMYLKTISELAVNSPLVPISALAGWLGVSAVSATEMIHRLQEHGLVEHIPYKGVCLTAEGRQQATGVVRNHRLWECFLVDHLNLPWETAHNLACRLEHATDPQITSALDVYLGRPQTCPHGNPIPTAGGAVRTPVDRPVADLPPDCPAVITRIHPESDDLLTYLAELELKTGTYVSLEKFAPFHGPLMLRINGGERYLSREAAVRVYARPVEEEV